MPDAASLKRLSQGRCKKVKWFSWGCRQSSYRTEDVITAARSQMLTSSWCPLPPTSSMPTEPEYRNRFWKPRSRCKMSLQGDLAGTPLIAGLLVGSCFTVGRQQCYNQTETSGKPEMTTHSPAHHRALKAKQSEITSDPPVFKCSNTIVWSGRGFCPFFSKHFLCGSFT